VLSVESTEGPWDPVSVLTTADRKHFADSWADLSPLNVPGPFYTGITDNCWTGRLHAPHNVVYAGEYFAEHVFRQPRDADEVAALVEAAEADPLIGYGCDGDDRWTSEAVRRWWRDRQSVLDTVTTTLEILDAEARSDFAEAAGGLREFLGYLEAGLETDLRAYLFRLAAGRYPGSGEQLPEL
jgi:hypothetical protein